MPTTITMTYPFPVTEDDERFNRHDHLRAYEWMWMLANAVYDEGDSEAAAFIYDAADTVRLSQKDNSNV